MILSPLPIQKFFANNGRPAVGYKLFTYEAGTSVKIATYVDSTGMSQNTNPIVLDYRGEARIWLDPLTFYKFVFAAPDDTDPPTSPIWSVDNISALGGLTQEIIGQILWPITPAEEAAGFDETTISFVGPQGYIPRYKIAPDDAGAATSNTAALVRLLDPTTDGPTGDIWFPGEEAGASTWYFNGIIQVRIGVQLDLGYGTLHFSKTREPSDDLMGFLTFIRDVTVKNGSIIVDYDGTGGTNAGSAIRFGSRPGYPYGIYTDGIFDQDDLVANGLPPQGNLKMENLRITSNNPAVSPMLGVGGLQNCLFTNLVIDAQSSGAIHGIYYEFGYSSDNGQPSTTYLWSSSHANNLVFTNIRVYNLDDSGGEGAGIALVGAYSSIIDGLYVNTANGIFEFRPGEALFYRPWPEMDAAGAKRCITLRNIVGENFAASSSNGLILTGAASACPGYLCSAVPPLTDNDQLDLMSFEVDGFAIDGPTTGINVSGPCEIKNGTVINCFNGIIIANECIQFDIDNVKVLDSGNVGIRANQDSAILTRNKLGSIRNSFVAGSTGAGISLDYAASVLVEMCRLGYNMAYDGVAETTQTIGVSVSADGSGVVCTGNFVSTNGSVAYNLASGAGSDESRGCVLANMEGTATYSGKWRGVVQTSTPVITAATPGDLAITYSQQTLAYIRNGDRVDFTFRIETSAFTYSTATGDFIIQNLPYLVNVANYGRSQAALSFSGITKATFTQFTAETVPNTTTINIIACGSGVAFLTLAITDLPSGGTVRLRGSGHYFI